MTFYNFWVQRFARLYPLHFITLFIVALFQYLYRLDNGTFFIYPFNDGYHFILNLGFISKWGLESGFSFNAPVWSVSVEIFLYFVFFIIAYKNLGGAFFCLVISLMEQFVIGDLGGLNSIMRGLSMFFLGGFVFHSTLALSTKLHRLKPTVYCIALLSWGICMFDCYVIDLNVFILNLGSVGRFFIKVFSAHILFSSTICALALIEIDKGHFMKSISWLGDITYSSYLLHFPLQMIFAFAVGYGILSPEFYLTPIYLGAFFVILIPLSYITFVGFERPMQKMIRDKYIRTETIDI